MARYTRLAVNSLVTDMASTGVSAVRGTPSSVTPVAPTHDPPPGTDRAMDAPGTPFSAAHSSRTRVRATGSMVAGLVHHSGSAATASNDRDRRGLGGHAGPEGRVDATAPARATRGRPTAPSSTRAARAASGRRPATATRRAGRVGRTRGKRAGRRRAARSSIHPVATVRAAGPGHDQDGVGHGTETGGVDAQPGQQPQGDGDGGGVPQVDGQRASAQEVDRRAEPPPLGQAADRGGQGQHGAQQRGPDDEVHHVGVVDDAPRRREDEPHRGGQDHADGGGEPERPRAGHRAGAGGPGPHPEGEEEAEQDDVGRLPRQPGSRRRVPAQAPVDPLQPDHGHHTAGEQDRRRPPHQPPQHRRQQQDPEQGAQVPERRGEPPALPRRPDGVGEGQEPGPERG